MQNQPSLPQHRKRWREGMMGFAIIPFAIVAVYFSVIRFHSAFPSKLLLLTNLPPKTLLQHGNACGTQQLPIDQVTSPVFAVYSAGFVSIPIDHSHRFVKFRFK